MFICFYLYVDGMKACRTERVWFLGVLGEMALMYPVRGQRRMLSFESTRVYFSLSLLTCV